MSRVISFIRRKLLRIPADRWDYQYGRGQWEGLAQEHARFDAVIALIHKDFTKPAILEIGCGKALMLQRMQKGDFSFFTGVDISEVAVAEARQFETEQIRFVCSDMQSFTPERAYDAIVFNESLYYARNPAAVFARYLKFLQPGGRIIVTAYENKYTAQLWPALDRRWQPELQTEVRSGENVWVICAYSAA